MEAIKPSELNTLLTIMRNSGYEIKERPFELNIVGVRTDNWTPNSFDDFIFYFYKDDNGNWQGAKNPATTDPGTYWLKNPMSSQGTAILKKGQYKNSHAIGSHRNQYTALVQVSPVTTIRDYDRDNKLSYESLKATTGLYGINIHRAGSIGTTKVVDKYSAGCQVFSDASDFAKFIEQAKKHKDLYGNLFNYTLIDEREDAILRRTKGDTFYSGDYRYHENTTGLPIDIYFEGQSPLLTKPVDGTTHCAGFTFAVCYITALNRGLLNGFTDDDLQKMWGVWTEADGTRYPKMCVKAISEPLRQGLQKLGREVSLSNASAGDFCQIWRTTGTTHQAILVEKIFKDGAIIGIKYLSSNPIINPDTGKTGIGLVAEFFSGSGGDMLTENTYFARLGDNFADLPTKPAILTQQETVEVMTKPNSKNNKTK
jgi:hypothetical protein